MSTRILSALSAAFEQLTKTGRRKAVARLRRKVERFIQWEKGNDAGLLSQVERRPRRRASGFRPEVSSSAGGGKNQNCRQDAGSTLNDLGLKPCRPDGREEFGEQEMWCATEHNDGGGEHDERNKR